MVLPITFSAKPYQVQRLGSDLHAGTLQVIGGEEIVPL